MQHGAASSLVTDGVCGSCLRPAPLRALAELARRRGGKLVVNDALAAGVLGQGRRRVGPRARRWGHRRMARSRAGPRHRGLARQGPVRAAGDRLRTGRARRTGPEGGPDPRARRPADDGRRRRPAQRAQQRLPRRTTLPPGPARGPGASDLGGPGALPARHPVPAPGHRRRAGRPPQDPARPHGSGGPVLATTGRCTDRPTLSICLRADHAEREIARLEQALRVAVSGRAA